METETHKLGRKPHSKGERMYARFDRPIAALAHAASSGDARPTLECVQVTASEITACNGHLAVRRPQDADGPLPAGMYDASAWRKVKPGTTPATAERANGSLVVTLPAGRTKPERSISIPARDDEAPYPDVDKVTPPLTDTTFTVGMAAAVLQTLLASTPDADAFEFAFTVSAGGTPNPTTAIRFREVIGTRDSHFGCAHGVLMPVRLPKS